MAAEVVVEEPQAEGDVAQRRVIGGRIVVHHDLVEGQVVDVAAQIAGERRREPVTGDAIDGHFE